MSRFYYYIFDGNKLRKISKKEAKESCQFFRAINMKVVLENLEPISEKSGKVKSSLLEEFEVGEKYVLRTAEHSLNGLVVSKSFSNADFLGTEIVSKEVYFFVLKIYQQKVFYPSPEGDCSSCKPWYLSN